MPPVQGCQVSLLLLQPSWKSQGVCLLCWAVQSSAWLSPVNSVTFYLWRKFNNWATQVPYLWRKFKSLRCAFPELLALPLINSPTPVSILAFSIGGAPYLPTRVEWSISFLIRSFYCSCTSTFLKWCFVVFWLVCFLSTFLCFCFFFFFLKVKTISLRKRQRKYLKFPYIKKGHKK